jgi:hypothetical protein
VVELVDSFVVVKGGLFGEVLNCRIEAFEVDIF